MVPGYCLLCSKTRLAQPDLSSAAVWHVSTVRTQIVCRQTPILQACLVGNGPPEDEVRSEAAHQRRVSYAIGSSIVSIDGHWASETPWSILMVSLMQPRISTRCRVRPLSIQKLARVQTGTCAVHMPCTRCIQSQPCPIGGLLLTHQGLAATITTPVCRT